LLSLGLGLFSLFSFFKGITKSNSQGDFAKVAIGALMGAYLSKVVGAVKKLSYNIYLMTGITIGWLTFFA